MHVPMTPMMSGSNQPGYDPGLTRQYTGALRRIINEDGAFNVQRRGARWRDVNLYLYLINMRWPAFLACVFAAYLAVNLAFACLYYRLGPEQIRGLRAATAFGTFMNAFAFSAHTLTTVGYGNIAPAGITAGVVSAGEAMLGLMGFALATGLLYGRFSRPSARIAFSGNMVVAPYRGIRSLQFRIANQRANVLMDLRARVLLMTVEGTPGNLMRNYAALNLEIANVHFLPLTWTVVHPIDAESPLFGKTGADLERAQAEVMILITAFDDSFSQVVHARRSYRYEEVVWGARFAPAFHVEEQGNLVLDLGRVGEWAPDVSDDPTGAPASG